MSFLTHCASFGCNVLFVDIVFSVVPTQRHLNSRSIDLPPLHVLFLLSLLLLLQGLSFLPLPRPRQTGPSLRWRTFDLQLCPADVAAFTILTTPSSPENNFSTPRIFHEQSKVSDPE